MTDQKAGGWSAGQRELLRRILGTKQDVSALLARLEKAGHDADVLIPAFNMARIHYWAPTEMREQDRRRVAALERRNAAMAVLDDAARELLALCDEDPEKSYPSKEGVTVRRSLRINGRGVSCASVFVAHAEIALRLRQVLELMKGDPAYRERVVKRGSYTEVRLSSREDGTLERTAVEVPFNGASTPTGRTAGRARAHETLRAAGLSKHHADAVLAYLKTRRL